MPLEPIPVGADTDTEVPANGFEVQLDVFTGPLDLLLHLIESRQLDVLTVSLADLADAYVEHLATRVVPPEQLADFVAMAAQLILLKSRRLLPGETPVVPGAEDEEADEDALRRRLVEYRMLRDASRELGERDLRLSAHRREPRESDLPEAASAALPVAVLVAALERMAAIPEPEPPPPEVVRREVTIAMQIAALRAAMARSGTVILQEMLATCRSRAEVSVMVLATLELVRRRQVSVRQDELFGPVLVERLRSGDGDDG
jgi:segregation and condensation protein A